MDDKNLSDRIMSNVMVEMANKVRRMFEYNKPDLRVEFDVYFELDVVEFSLCEEHAIFDESYTILNRCILNKYQHIVVDKFDFCQYSEEQLYDSILHKYNVARDIYLIKVGRYIANAVKL